MAKPIVSIVMSVFNGERFLREAVESILNQTFHDFEFIIIDDGSTDSSGSILNAYQRSDCRVRAYHQENKGLIESLNRGCGIAQGKYIARMDADDMAVTERLARQIDFMKTHPEVAVLGTAVEFIDDDGKALRIASFPLSHREIQQIALDRAFLWHPSVLMRKSAWSRVGGYRNVAHAEDYDLWLRIADHFELANLPQVLLKYRLHATQVSVTSCRKQALGAAAARAAAIARRNGQLDPLQSIREITPEVLTRLGVSESMQKTTLARAYLSTVRNMCASGEYRLALDMLEILRSSELRNAEAWTVADLRVCAAKIYWQQHRFAKSALTALRAVVKRPLILGRPLKSLITNLSSTFRTN
jgi:cellulose synthase/poly-beta-1,6-N-acetylglucosamine synthase-like glycosyltransferase